MSAAADNPHPHIDPSLVALAAQVQAHANAQAQRHVSISTPHRHIPPATTDNHLGLGLPSEALGPALQIDPSLFEIEQVVNDVRRGKIRLGEDRRDEQELERPIQHPNDTAHHSQHQQQADHPGEQGGLEGHGGLGDTSDGLQMDDEIDPTLREIVNSLTNAQQSSHLNGPGLSHAQAAAAIGAHLTDAEERERLQQSLQASLEDLTHASFGSLFPPNYSNSPSQGFLTLNDHHNIHDTEVDLSNPSLDVNAEVGSSSTSLDASPMAGPESSNSVKRGRGRPKGSKNKPKPGPPPPKPPKPPKPPARPKGRPPKQRTPAEQAEYELRKHEKELGIKRQKGRPRKFPGYLVREMRLKKNREEFNELMREYEEKKREEELTNLEMAGVDTQIHLGEGPSLADHDHHVHNSHLHGEHHGHHEQHDFSDWSVQDDQTLLDVVGVGHHGMSVGIDEEEQDHHEGMDEVFGIRS
ncbi:hypothetical protein C343_00283 [Cryptococcus neoformans C23]|uniref:Uncharacterized protein n=2 Tax=Cryptococcus neoformans TaxID=5207 RepID=A0A854QMU9_CRYNE|nr:hypothetical protein CNAG_07345 [Cryptococcus neoformans var. grubii H99]AUB21842.1 hypothetical protein CKF44_07345 [Cryptococcus neoformans var. grubii]OWZ37000.1 hypothetical protein C347_00360 [Cryptococcus neoformans var. grubii AD2-60a]OWZ48831.1 hypothetical protein C343_00283 [Cryptococcus neoformans var. grubii C23]OWZ58764.1 hypothetical protein C368_00281 [Cryptococcus neoformans var. grubii 125.91]OXC87345.1 hypothetical protein C344_00295 [Cryptococcus neoformans var. grubii AD|eukprot:XP_012047045.1 hypothetical protein CNAG_07345 [Cryptococcus neoformans var. grubii H99]